jgi:hypothetical protein
MKMRKNLLTNYAFANIMKGNLRKSIKEESEMYRCCPEMPEIKRVLETGEYRAGRRRRYFKYAGAADTAVIDSLLFTINSRNEE